MTLLTFGFVCYSIFSITHQLKHSYAVHELLYFDLISQSTWCGGSVHQRIKDFEQNSTLGSFISGGV